MGHSKDYVVYKYLLKLKCVGRISWKFREFGYLKILYGIRYEKIDVIPVQWPFKYAVLSWFMEM